MRIVEKRERNAAFAKLSREAALEKVGAKDTDVRAAPRRQEQQRLRQDHQDDGRGRASRHGRRREAASRRPQGRRDPPDLVEGRHPAARSRYRRFHARSNASAHRRDPRFDRRRTAPRRHHGDSEQALHALLQLPAVFGRRDAPDARTRPPRNRPRPPRRTRAGADPAAAGRVPLHDALDQRNARIQRLVVDGVDLRFDARADGCRRADSEARRAASRWA